MKSMTILIDIKKEILGLLLSHILVITFYINSKRFNIKM